MEIQEYLIKGAREMFNLQIREAYDNLTNAPDYSKECLERMKAINEDFILFEQIGLIKDTDRAILEMGDKINELENKLNEIN